MGCFAVKCKTWGKLEISLWFATYNISQMHQNKATLDVTKHSYLWHSKNRTCIVSVWICLVKYAHILWNAKATNIILKWLLLHMHLKQDVITVHTNPCRQTIEYCNLLKLLYADN